MENIYSTDQWLSWADDTAYITVYQLDQDSMAPASVHL